MAEVKDSGVFSAMQEQKPLKRYIKTVLGKVYVTVLNPFSGEPEGVILEGDPRKQGDLEKIVVNVWDTKQDVFFRRMNRNHFDSGNIREYSLEEVEPPVSANEITDEEILDVLNKPFLALKNKLVKFTAVAPVFRLLSKAEELEKSEKILGAIRERMSELELTSPSTGA
jgi:hypothetical protein